MGAIAACDKHILLPWFLEEDDKARVTVKTNVMYGVVPMVPRTRGVNRKAIGHCEAIYKSTGGADALIAFLSLDYDIMFYAQSLGVLAPQKDLRVLAQIQTPEHR